MNLSARGLALIAEFEGFVGHGYNDAAGHCTIGYGHLLHHGQCSHSELARTISRTAAKALLDRDADRFEQAVDGLVGVQPRYARNPQWGGQRWPVELIRGL